MHSAGLALTKLTYTRLEDNLIRHRGDRLIVYTLSAAFYSKPLSVEQESNAVHTKNRLVHTVSFFFSHA